MEPNIIQLPVQIFKMRERIPQEIQQTAKALLASVDLPEESAEYLTNLDFRKAQEYKRQREECANCNGDRYKCRKISASFDEDGKIVFTYSNCQKTLEYQRQVAAIDIIKKARVPKIFANIRAKDFDTENQFNECALDFAEDAILENQSVYIFGKCGAGKTMLASIIANERAFLGRQSFFVNIPDLLEELRDTSATKESNRFRLMERINSSSCLIIDDLGAEKPSDWTCETLFRIFNHRYNEQLQTIVTSNFSIDGLQRRLDFIAGERIVRRIRETCTEIELRR